MMVFMRRMAARVFGALVALGPGSSLRSGVVGVVALLGIHADSIVAGEAAGPSGCGHVRPALVGIEVLAGRAHGGLHMGHLLRGGSEVPLVPI